MLSDKTILRSVAVLLILLVGSQLYLFVAVHRLQTETSAKNGGYTATDLAALEQASSTAAANEKVVDGVNQIAYIGTLAAINGSTLQVATKDGDFSFITNSSTTFTSPGVQKSNIEYQKEVSAFETKEAELMQAPQKNAAAIRALTPPSNVTQINLSLADLQVGDTVAVTPGDKSGSSIQALRVAKLPPESVQ